MESMPTCRDCGYPTRFSKRTPNQQLQIECSIVPYNHTRGSYQWSEEEAKKVYPEKLHHKLIRFLFRISILKRRNDNE